MIRTERSEYPDSIELGRVGKGGVIKVYFNADNPEQTERRIANAVKAREYLLEKLGGVL